MFEDFLSLFCRYSLYGKETASQTADKENPFIVCGQVYSSDIENVVHLFLQSSAIFPSLTHLNNNNNNSNSRRHSTALTTTRLPGKIENLQSPIRYWLPNMY